MITHRKTMDEIPAEVWDSVRAKWVMIQNGSSFDDAWGHGCALCDYLGDQCLLVSKHHRFQENCNICPIWAHWCRTYSSRSRIAPKYHKGDLKAWSEAVTEFIEFITPYCTKATLSAEENDR